LCCSCWGIETEMACWPSPSRIAALVAAVLVRATCSMPMPTAPLQALAQAAAPGGAACHRPGTGCLPGPSAYGGLRCWNAPARATLLGVYRGSVGWGRIAPDLQSFAISRALDRASGCAAVIAVAQKPAGGPAHRGGCERFQADGQLEWARSGRELLLACSLLPCCGCWDKGLENQPAQLLAWQPLAATAGQLAGGCMALLGPPWWPHPGLDAAGRLLAVGWPPLLLLLWHPGPGVAWLLGRLAMGAVAADRYRMLLLFVLKARGHPPRALALAFSNNLEGLGRCWAGGCETPLNQPGSGGAEVGPECRAVVRVACSTAAFRWPGPLYTAPALPGRCGSCGETVVVRAGGAAGWAACCWRPQFVLRR